jgi:ubiquinone/menaquinone biosynthesis C-methylase UbiE
VNNNIGKPIAQEAYDTLADAYAAQVDAYPCNAHYEKPATLSLLPDVAGKRVLDAGCGPGVYTQWLVERGASVVAVDANEKMVGFTKERLGDKAQVFHANLEKPLDFFGDESFDIVVSPLVLDYVEDWKSLFAEFYRILEEEGCLVFSMEHPYAIYNDHRETSNYFSVELVECEWTGFGIPVRMPSYRRPMSEVINPLIMAGFRVDQLLEPVPSQEFKQYNPEEYEILSKTPGFMCVRAIKR